MLPSWKSRERLRGGGWLLPPSRSSAFWRPAGNSWHPGAGTAAVGSEKHLPREQRQLQKGKDKARTAGGAPRGVRPCRGSTGRRGGERRNHPQGRGFCNGAALGAFGKRKEVGSRGCQPIPGHFGNLQSPALGLAVLVNLNFASAKLSR